MSTPTTRRPEKVYDLALEPDGRAYTARQNLTDIFERELLGPANGPEEVLDGTPDAAYLVGRIAPTALLPGRSDPTASDDELAATDVGDAVDAEASRGVIMTAVDDSSAAADEDAVDDVPQQRGLIIPASMGLRFQVRDDLPSFTVMASWGVYNPISGEGDDEESRKRRRYQRTPVDIPCVVTVADLKAGETTEYVLKDDVKLRIDRYDDTERHRLLIEVALCNDRVTPRKIPVSSWLYQTKLYVSAGDDPEFLPVLDVLEDDRYEPDAEIRRLNLQYRDRLEFAIGRTCSVDWSVAKGARRASKVWTTWLPTSETPQTLAPDVPGVTLDMLTLAEASADEVQTGLAPIAEEYWKWLKERDDQAGGLPDHLQEDAGELVEEARKVWQQLQDGLAHLASDGEALRCFRLMNRVMADQRIQSQVAALRTNQPELGLDEARQQVLDRGPRAHSWRMFQLAFIVMQLPMLTDPTCDRRSDGELAKAQLLFFPTGGGKTEAYLGLAAYTFAIRRRQGVIASAEGDLDGMSGIAVVMRYTLRLLTAQQFQRATTLICAAENERRAYPDIWGDEPFRIGLWVGSDVSPKRYKDAAEQLSQFNEGRTRRLTVLQIQRCPWCGTKIGGGQVKADDTTRRIRVFCGEEFGECPFAQGGNAVDGLPILTVDEEIYRLTPSFLIATVDKFARLAREGEAAALFGYVSRRCDRHGYVHPDYDGCDIRDGNKHPKSGSAPAAAVHPVPRLRPPDLIIQDELHLITGSLGTTVGLFEVAFDLLCSWRTPGGDPVRPLVVASTATARNAVDQVRALYGRGTTVFPPQVIDVGHTFFSQEQDITEEMPGRRYVGVSTTGVRLTTAEIRVTEILLAAGQLLLDRSVHESGAEADPYLTLVAYFNATRELAGMARYLGDDVQTLLAKGRPWSALPRRRGTDFGTLHVAELTSRVSSVEIGTTLDEMAVPFTPAQDSTAARRLAAGGERLPPKRRTHPFDAVLATSMLQVGVDVTRLGLMLMVGQPKNTAEYIQASSRVGREADRPGLVISLGNWARPRDLAHFEQFRHYHATFYAQVEALSVTPFSLTSMERGLSGLLVSAARVRDASVSQGLSPELQAGRIEDERQRVVELIEALTARIRKASGEAEAQTAQQQLLSRLDQWEKRKSTLDSRSQGLAYEKVGRKNDYGALLISAENAAGLPSAKNVPPFRVPNSMREVQPEINLLVSPNPDKLFMEPTPGTPRWQPPTEENDA
jgi:Helicase conserved C-terminal domain